MGTSGKARPGEGCQGETASQPVDAGPPSCTLLQHAARQTGTPTLTPSQRPEEASQEKSDCPGKGPPLRVPKKDVGQLPDFVQTPCKELLDLPGHLEGQSGSTSLPKGKGQIRRRSAGGEGAKQEAWECHLPKSLLKSRSSDKILCP